MYLKMENKIVRRCPKVCVYIFLDIFFVEKYQESVANLSP